MDPFELMYRRPVPVKSTTTNADFDFDEGLIDRVLGRPNKIEIPERYIPEREQLAPEEEQKRSEKAEAICRLLSKSNSAGPIPLVLPHPSRHHQSQHLPNHHHHQNHPNHHHHQNHPNHHHHQNHPNHQHQQNHPNYQHQQDHPNYQHQQDHPKYQHQQDHPKYQHHQNHPNYQHHQSHQSHPSHISYGSSRSIQSGLSASESLGVNSHILPSASPNRRPLSSSLKKASSSSRINNRNPTRNSSTCDWSLAGVSAPTSPHPSSNLSRNSYYSSSTSASSLFAPTSGLAATKPNHSYHSSYSSTSSGRSSSDREELLHLQHNIAREVTEKSRLVAVRALASSPSPNPYRYSGGSRYRDPSPPSPIDLPTVQQREGFFT
ncbi:unnamed protein product [Allacma fusca]|uniref:Uncharacterized protein n=1 Tax=Allacma fusca TaxID=39272 RepID=A0A8J2JYT7_9HEXA|nr:unnamed protein product [Allacma fusca]